MGKRTTSSNRTRHANNSIHMGTPPLMKTIRNHWAAISQAQHNKQTTKTQTQTLLAILTQFQPNTTNTQASWAAICQSAGIVQTTLQKTLQTDTFNQLFEYHPSTHRRQSTFVLRDIEECDLNGQDLVPQNPPKKDRTEYFRNRRSHV
jgi:hypothetical protein